MQELVRVLTILFVCLFAFTHTSAKSSPDTTHSNQPKPNIIIVFVDDLGWGDLSINGAKLIETPNIDRIGKDGINLTSFYAAANVCTPSRAALLTGRYPIRSGMQHIVYPQSVDGLPQTEVTLAEMLKSAGYATGMVGKWHLGHQDEHWPTEHGFDEFFGVAYSNDMQPFDLYRAKSVVQSPVDQSELTNNYAKAAVEFINQHKNHPFLLYYAETFPHIPLFTPKDAEGQSQAGQYGDVVEHLDAGIGKLLDALEVAGVADNTLIIFTSDNGPWFEGDAGPYRNRKGGTHEGSYRVPFLARWPAAIKPAQVSNEMAMTIDLLPTIAAIAGATLPQDRTIDGRDILPMLLNGAPSPHDFLYFFNGNDIAAVRDRRFRLVLSTYYKTFPVPFEQFGTALLFDLRQDAQERFSYLREFPSEYKKLMAAVTAMREETKSMRKEPLDPFAPVPNDAPRGPQLKPD